MNVWFCWDTRKTPFEKLRENGPIYSYTYSCTFLSDIGIVLVFNVFCNSLMPATIFDLKIYLDSKIFKLCQFFQNCIEVLEAICRGDFGSCVSAAQDYQTKCHRLFPLCPSFIIPANSQPDQILANGS